MNRLATLWCWNVRAVDATLIDAGTMNLAPSDYVVICVPLLLVMAIATTVMTGPLLSLFSPRQADSQQGAGHPSADPARALPLADK